MNEHEIAFIKGYSKEVSDTFRAAFDADNRFPDWPRLARRFVGAADSVLKYGFSKLGAVEATHNELCIAGALLASGNLDLSVLIMSRSLKAAVSRSISGLRLRMV